MKTFVLIIFGGGAALVLLSITTDLIILRRAGIDLEERVNQRPGILGLVIAWLAFHLVAFWCELGRIWGLARKRLFWRTDCSWCGCRVRSPIIWRPHPTLSHTICADCFEQTVGPMPSSGAPGRGTGPTSKFGGDAAAVNAGSPPATSSPHPQRQTSLGT